jgi:uncharacterized protein YndB with AHSA1/START domain
VSKPKFVYVTYIQSSLEKVFAALTESEWTRQYWIKHSTVCDWQVGSKWRQEDCDDSSIVDITGTVVEYSPPHKLVLTWAGHDNSEDLSTHSRVTISLDLIADAVRLTVVHEDLDEEGVKGVGRGWPVILASMKTLLETGKPLDLTNCRKEEFMASLPR